MAGFLPSSEGGLVGFAGLFGAAKPDEAGTTLEFLSSGFLCVISLLSTFLRPLVTFSPPPSSAKRPLGGPVGGAAEATTVFSDEAEGGAGAGAEEEEAAKVEASWPC